MVIHDLNIVSIPLPPNKADAPLVVDSNAVLPAATAMQRFEPIARRRGQIAQVRSSIQLRQFSLRDPFDGAEAFHPLPQMEAFRLLRAEGPDHPPIV